MQLNTFQNAAVRTYAAGRYAHIAAIADADELRTAIDEVDDMAFHEFMSGLADPEIDTKEKAVVVLREAIKRARDFEMGTPTFAPA